MKTLFVFNHPAPYKVHVFNELSKQIDLQVIFERESAKDRPASFYAGNEYNFPVIFLKHGAIAYENTISAGVKNYIKKHHQEYDVIVMNGYRIIAEMRAIRYMIKHNIPYVLQINGGVIKKDSKWKKKIKTYYISHAQKYISPCEKADEYLIHYGARKEDIYRYPYANYFEREIITSLPSQKEKMEIRKKWNLPDKKIFVNASQFIERKNNLQLMSIFKDREEVLLLVGAGKEKEKYEKYIRDSNIKNIILMDFLKKQELFEVMKSCDYFITLSLEDIFGHTTLEAMAVGLPVISSDRVVSSLDLIKNGINGYVVDINNNDEIIKAIESVNDSMRQAAINTAKSNTIEQSAIGIQKALEEIVK